MHTLGSSMSMLTLQSAHACGGEHCYKLPDSLLWRPELHPSSVSNTVDSAQSCFSKSAADDCAWGAGVVVDGEEVKADAVVIAMGPWSGLAAKWLPVPDVTGQKYASIVLRPEEEISNHMLFLSYKTISGKAACPCLKVVFICRNL